jgi:hypothetical protein
MATRFQVAFSCGLKDFPNRSINNIIVFVLAVVIDTLPLCRPNSAFCRDNTTHV